MRVNVLGAGSWGTALAILLARNDFEVTLFGRHSEELEGIAHQRENFRYLPGFAIPKNVTVVWQDDDLQEADLWVIAVPSGAFRAVLRHVKGENPLCVIATKGIEPSSTQLLCEVAQQELPSGTHGVISGPNLAIEIARGIPTVAVCAYQDQQVADRVRMAFMCRSFRVYTSSDIVGVEIAGALKNVMAIAAGMSDALGFGDNTKGALLARGLFEMASLGLALGARLETFMGIAGVGDLFATAVSKFSRNYRVGLAIGSGALLSEALEAVGQVAEGVSTAESALVLARRNQIQMPTFEAVDSVLRSRVAPMKAVEMLMERMPRTESILPDLRN